MEACDLLIPLEGLLQKFTNVMKGFQYRFFVINPDSGYLEYYLSEDNYKQKLKPRNSIYLGDSIISPSEEDSCTFTINSPLGENFKLKALDARERQIWVNRLRSVSEHFNDKLEQQSTSTNDMNKGTPAKVIPNTTSTDFFSNMFNFDNIAKNLAPTKISINNSMQSSQSVPSITNASIQPSHTSLKALEADSENQLTAVHEVLRVTQRHFDDIKDMIESLSPSVSQAKPIADKSKASQAHENPSEAAVLGCLDPDLLMLKATTYATVDALKACLNILEQSLDVGYLNEFLMPAQHSSSTHSSHAHTSSISYIPS